MNSIDSHRHRVDIAAMAIELGGSWMTDAELLSAEILIEFSQLIEKQFWKRWRRKKEHRDKVMRRNFEGAL